LLILIHQNGGQPPLTYQSFIALAGRPVDPLATTYSLLPPLGETGDHELLNVPKIEDLGYGDISEV
jgi:cryptochrome